MISKRYVEVYCSESLELIENYDLAINSAEIWDCHHRLEIQDGKLTSREELIDRGLYYGRPASELIFLRRGEHIYLHSKADYRAKKAIKAAHSPEAESKRIANGGYKKATEAMNAKCRKAIIQFTKSGEFIKEYDGTRAAERETGIIHNNISACAKGKLKSAGGFIWKYR